MMITMTVFSQYVALQCSSEDPRAPYSGTYAALRCCCCGRRVLLLLLLVLAVADFNGDCIGFIVVCVPR